MKMSEIEKRSWLKEQKIKKQNQHWTEVQRTVRNINIDEWRKLNIPRKWKRRPQNDIKSLFEDGNV